MDRPKSTREWMNSWKWANKVVSVVEVTIGTFDIHKLTFDSS